MYMTSLLTLWMEVLEKVFDQEFPDPDFRGLHISPEYPLTQTSYPGIWLDYQPTSDLRNVGIGHAEYSEPGADNQVRKVGRWSYQGTVQLTIVTLNNLERARLADHIVNLMAFGLQNPNTSEFRKNLDQNDLLPMMVQWDQFNLGGKGEVPGTPWGTEQVVYEITATITVEGTFLSAGTEMTLIPLSAVKILEPTIEGETPDPTTQGGGWI